MSFDELFGKTICRPRDYFTFDLEQENLNVGTVLMQVPATPGARFEDLAKGEVDVFCLNVPISKKEIAVQGLKAEVIDLPAL